MTEPVPPTGQGYGVPLPLGGPGCTPVVKAGPVGVRVKVRRAGGGRRLTYRLKNLGRGGRVRFVEEGKGVRRQVGVATRASGRLRFQPANGPAGPRAIRAVIVQDGLVRTSRVVARYRTGAVRPATPKRLRVRRGTTTAVISCSGPRSAYRVNVRSSDGRRVVIVRDAGRRRRVTLRAVPPRATLRVRVQAVATGGRVSRTNARVSRGRR